MQGKKQKAGLYQSSRECREYFGAESKTFLSTNKFTKKIYPHDLLNMFFFFISEIITIDKNMVFQLLKNFKVDRNQSWVKPCR